MTVAIPLSILYWIGFIPAIIPMLFIRKTFIVIFPAWIYVVTWLIICQKYLGM